MADLNRLVRELCESLNAPAGETGGLAARELRARVAAFCDAAGFSPKVTPANVLKRAALEVDEIVDVGVYKGTPFLYDAFPGCALVLVDPLHDAESKLEQKPARYKFVNAALGASAGTMTLKQLGPCSTFLTWADAERANPQAEYPVPVITLDELLRRELTSDRIGIKIDAEGYEAEVIRGLATEAHRVQFIIAELSIKRRLFDAPYFSDVVALLRDKGFAFYNFMEDVQANARRYHDVLFLRRDDPRFVA